MKKIITLAMGLMLGSTALVDNVSAQNPYLPLWEFIPDGEPYVFEDPDNPGKYRVYVYGSHDNLIQFYCGRDQVVWSAPVENLKDWRYDGVIFVSKKDAQGKWLAPIGKNPKKAKRRIISILTCRATSAIALWLNRIDLTAHLRYATGILLIHRRL